MAEIVKKLGEIDRQLRKSEIINLATENAQTVIESGKFDLLKVYIELKRYETYLKTIISIIGKHAVVKAGEVVRQTAAPDRLTFEYANAQVHLTTRTIRDFSSDKRWKELDDTIRDLTLKKKEREKYLIANSKTVTLVNEETGEITQTSDLLKEISKGLTIRL